MAKQNFVFTSESVSEGHPDKICDRISDAIVDTYLAAEPEARCGVETLVTTNRVVLAGEVRGPAAITGEQLIEVARRAIRDIGYEQENFHWERAAIKCHIHGQSANIAQGVDASGNKDEGAGDQGMMFGYACNETPALMPAPIFYAHAMLRALSEARHSGNTPLLGPDAKSQVTLQYEAGKPVRATKVVVSIQHSDRIDQDEVREIIRPYVVSTLPDGWMCDEQNFLVNPTGVVCDWRAAMAMPALPAARSSSIHMAEQRHMAAARSPARTRPKWTARPPMRRAISPRTWSAPDWLSAVRSKSPTRSASRSHCPFMSTPKVRSTRTSSGASCRS